MSFSIGVNTRSEFLTRPIRHAFRFTVLMHSSTNSPESGLGESRTSLPGSGGEEYYVDEIDAQPPLGTCRALYPFDGTCVSFSDAQNYSTGLHFFPSRRRYKLKIAFFF